MKDKTNEALLQLLNKAMQGIDEAVRFGQQQIPDVIHQLLVWNAVTSLLVQVLAVIIIAAPMVACVKKWKFLRSHGAESVAVVNAFTVTLGVFMFFNNFDWLKIWLAPKIYLIEYTANLMR